MDTQMLEKLQTEKGTVLVEFYATWCPHCKKMMPVVDDVKALLDGKVPVYQFDIDKYGDLADELKVETIPTFMVFKNGELEWRASGEMEGDALYGKVAEYMD